MHNHTYDTPFPIREITFGDITVDRYGRLFLNHRDIGSLKDIMCLPEWVSLSVIDGFYLKGILTSHNINKECYWWNKNYIVYDRY
jgi:hypothetical protein